MEPTATRTTKAGVTVELTFGGQTMRGPQWFWRVPDTAARSWSAIYYRSERDAFDAAERWLERWAPLGG